MKKSQKKESRKGRYRIQCNYAPEVLVPAEAIERAFYEYATPDSEEDFITMDGKVCRPEFIMTWSDVPDGLLDDFCMRRWNMPFDLVRSLWYDRLELRRGLMSWHFIRLHELG